MRAAAPYFVPGDQGLFEIRQPALSVRGSDLTGNGENPPQSALTAIMRALKLARSEPRIGKH